MDIAIVRFTTKWPPNPTSPVIARLAGSKVFSHCMTIIDEVATEATMIHGCRNVPVDVAMQGVAKYQDMYVPIPNKAGAIAFGEDQEGKDYDFAGAFGLPFLASDNWDDWNKWWCSEITFMQLAMGGTWVLDPIVCTRVAPIHILMCNYPKSEIITVSR